MTEADLVNFLRRNKVSGDMLNAVFWPDNPPNFHVVILAVDSAAIKPVDATGRSRYTIRQHTDTILNNADEDKYRFQAFQRAGGRCEPVGGQREIHF